MALPRVNRLVAQCVDMVYKPATHARLACASLLVWGRRNIRACSEEINRNRHVAAQTSTKQFHQRDHNKFAVSHGPEQPQQQQQQQQQFAKWSSPRGPEAIYGVSA